MNKSYVIGLDIGTTSAKSVLFDRNGSVVSEHEVEYTLSHPFPGWVEQDPIAIELGAINAIKYSIQKGNIDPNELLAVGISSAMHSIICIDRDLQPLSPSITWADGRSFQQAENLMKENGTDIYLKTGTPIHPMSPFVKLLWMKETGYEPYKKAFKFVSIKEFLLGRWFNQLVVDYSVASATGLFDIHKLDWDEQALQIVGISYEQLPTPVRPTHILEGISSRVCEEMGIPATTPFVVGGSDGPLANLGIGAITPEDIAITIGTSGAIRKMASQPKTDAKQEVFCYAFDKDLWVTGGPTNNGGIVFRWLREVLGQQEVSESLTIGKDAYDLLTELASHVNPGANGLIYLPFLNGERAPHWDANAKGAYIGLSASHEKSHLIRSGLEGVIFNIYQIGETLERLTGSSNRLLASGGFARSSLWLQILADIFGKKVEVPLSHQSSAWGASWTALYALNEVPSFQAIKDYIPMQDTYLPIEANHLIYQELYPIFKNLYQSLKPSFHAISEFQRKN
ncbi:MAG TPA: FGGY family carbohydrate kinase [Pseudoneobacillus sp.]|nr:FGGY family carbohydrate kinase [Pseudoneobacillus sp.]